MSKIAKLMMQDFPPHLSEMAAAVHDDVADLVLKWQQGDVLSMISARDAAAENVARVLLDAARAALNDAGDADMSGLIDGYLRGRHAEMTFANRNRHTDAALDIGAIDIEDAAYAIVTRFRDQMGNE